MAYTLGCCFFGVPKNVAPSQPTVLSGWTLSSVSPTVWAGLVAVAGLGIYLFYRRSKSSLSGLIIKADGTEETYKPAKKKFTLEELQHAVGGYIERVPAKLGGRRKMWVDEEGLMKGKPVNRKATQMAREGGYGWDVPIVGDALITEPGEGI